MNCGMKTVRPSPRILMIPRFFPEAWIEPERVWKWVPQSMQLCPATLPGGRNEGTIGCWCPCLTEEYAGRAVGMRYWAFGLTRKRTRKLKLYAGACPECGTVYWSTIVIPLFGPRPGRLYP